MLSVLLAPVVPAQILVYFNQSSDPTGIVANTSTLVATGTVVSTVTAPMTSNTYHFVYWTINDARQADALGQGLNPVAFTITEPVTAVAHYLLATTDTDGNGIPDWFEVFFYGVLTNGSNSDTDGDSFTLLDEYNRDYNPNVPDSFVDGGISQRSSPLITCITAASVYYSEISSPTGFVNNLYIVATNTVRVLPDVSSAGLGSGYRFGEWRTNGVRVADALGRSVGGLSIVVDATMTNAVAMFYSASQSTAGDGVPDWFKWQYYGTTNISVTIDTDAEGFTLLDEYNRDYNPSVPDSFVDGGISQRASALTLLDLRTYAFYKLTSNPTGFLYQTAYVQVGTNITTAALWGPTNGYVFVRWELNGVSQHDATGYPISPISFTVYSNTTATAFYYAQNTDSNANGIPDWWEEIYFGGATAANANADPDGDGMTNLQEYLAGTDPRSSTSRLAITSLLRGADGWRINFSSSSGKLYQVEYTADLRQSNSWQTVPGQTNILGTGAIIQIVDPTATNVLQRFYRIRLTQ